MAAFSFTCKSLSAPPYPNLNASHQSIQVSRNSLFFSRSPAVRFSGELDRRRMRGLSVITRAGPSSSQFIFAFVFPLSLMAITVFAAFRIGDNLDQKFLEELAMNEAMREEEDNDDDNDDGGSSEVGLPRKEEPALPRTRNRPKREV